ncbi:MAG TPA: STM4014 family protein, partial [Blastocatellia bacterium]|nr:STM4014 family protein [Blastocatellia bacterium]
MSPSASEPSFIIIAPPESNRVALFQQALADYQLAPARVVSYLDLLTGIITLPQVVHTNSLLRIESPGKSFETDKAFLALGAEIGDTEKSARISTQEVNDLSFDKGRILWPRQWYLGFCETLRLIEKQLSDRSPLQLMNAPHEIAMMFDKPRCYELLRSHQISVPRSLGVIRSFDELIERMKQMQLNRVFVKLAHGSSASGVVAYQTNGRAHQAITTVEIVRHQGELRLYNSRRLQIYRDRHEIAALINE